MYAGVLGKIEAEIEMHVCSEQCTYIQQVASSILVRDLFTTPREGSLLCLRGGKTVRIIVRKGMLFNRYTCICKLLRARLIDLLLFRSVHINTKNIFLVKSISN